MSYSLKHILDKRKIDLDKLAKAVFYLSNDADSRFSNELTREIEHTYPMGTEHTMEKAQYVIDGTAKQIRKILQFILGTSPVSMAGSTSIGILGFIATWTIYAMVASMTSCSNAVISEKVCLLAIYALSLTKVIEITSKWLYRKSEIMNKHIDDFSHEIRAVVQDEIKLAKSCAERLDNLNEQLRESLDLKGNSFYTLFNTSRNGHITLNKNVSPRTVINIMRGNCASNFKNYFTTLTKEIPTLLENIAIGFNMELFDERQREIADLNCTFATKFFRSMAGETTPDECSFYTYDNNNPDDRRARLSYVEELLDSLSKLTTEKSDYIHVRVYNELKFVQRHHQEKEHESKREKEMEDSFENGTVEMCFNENDGITDEIEYKVKADMIERLTSEKKQNFCDVCVYGPEELLKKEISEKERASNEYLVEANKQYCNKQTEFTSGGTKRKKQSRRKANNRKRSARKN